MSGFVSIVFLELLAVAISSISFCNGSTSVGCIQSEREALLRFKQDLTDSSNRLSSWVGDGDCCKWAAVVCHNFTGHVLELHLQNPFSNYFRNFTASEAEVEAYYVRSMLGGKINPSLLDLNHLLYLNLSHNYFDQGEIPRFLGSMRSLRYLDLKLANFVGVIPRQLGNLSQLQYLDLSENVITLNAESLSSLSGLSSLEHLDLSSLLFRVDSDWLLQINKLSSLTVLRLEYCGLHHIPPLPFANFSSSLTTLDISNNIFDNSLIPSWVFDLQNLEYLDLSYNNFKGPIPEALQNFSSLQHLDLRSNSFNSSIPKWFSRLRSLEFLDISFNSIIGHVPSSLGELFSVRYLYLSDNKLNGTLSQIHLANLARLIDFDLSGNSLTLDVNYDWVPPFQLETLLLRSCHLGPRFPSWLHSQRQLAYLDISDTRIVDSIPSWFWRPLSRFIFLNLSHNQIQGEIPDLSSVVQLEFLDFSSNTLSGPLPLISSNMLSLDLSNNAFSGSIFQFLCHKINESRKTQILKLGKNSLYGELPNCWINWQDLLVLELSDNNFMSNIPHSIGDLSALQSLHLRNNSFFGVIPPSLKNCTRLVTLDIGENDFSGNIPSWIGEIFFQLVIFNLRSNKFHGHLPTNFCHLTFLQILDVAYNDLSGPIPKCINNFSAMVTKDFFGGNSISFIDDRNISFLENEPLVMKGVNAKYDSILNLVRIIDLSENKFFGEIPIEVTNLHALKSLNLSHNYFSGRIPKAIGDMKELETIDLSANQLDGQIPQSITSLTYLNHLNLSNNKLTGEIPLGTQLQSFNASSFTGNELCGPPLLRNCTVATVPTLNRENGKGDQDNNEDEVVWFWVSMALGFVVGFWSLIGPLLINRRWRYMYCRFLDRLGDKLYFGARNLC